MDEQTARHSALTKIAQGHAAQGHRLHKLQPKRGNTKYDGRRNNPKQQHRSRSADAKAAGKRIVCYNCNEPGHIAPNCPKKKENKENKRQSANATSSSEIACVAATRHTDDLTNSRNIVYASPDNPNTTFQKDVGLNMFLMNDVYATIYFNAWDYYGKPRVSYADIEAYIHSHPLQEELLDFAVILNLDLSLDTQENIEEIEEMINEGLIRIFRVDYDHPKYKIWSKQVNVIIHAKILSLQQDLPSCMVLVCTTDMGLQLTFYPPTVPQPILRTHENVTRSFVTFESPRTPSNHAVAAMAIDAKKNLKSMANAIKRKDPSIAEIGDPRNLQNYLLDSGATQHMTP
jgi:hypothetical protein